MIIRLASLEFGRIDIDGQRVTVDRRGLGRLVTTAVIAALGGMEVLVGIPGTVGGALHGNTGSHGGDIGQWTASATVVTTSGETQERTRDDLVFGAGSLDETVILEALVLEEDDPRGPANAEAVDHETGQPADGAPMRGCIFKDPAAHGGRIDRQIRTERDADRRRLS